MQDSAFLVLSRQEMVVANLFPHSIEKSGVAAGDILHVVTMLDNSGTYHQKKEQCWSAMSSTSTVVGLYWFESDMFLQGFISLFYCANPLRAHKSGYTVIHGSLEHWGQWTKQL
jgi:hypothetical protein